MKIKHIFAALTILSTLLFASVGHAAFVTATNSGNWSDTNIWNTAILPTNSDDVFIAAGVNVTVDITNAMAFTIGDDTIGVAGAVTMAPNTAISGRISSLYWMQPPREIPSFTGTTPSLPSNVIITI
jgi:hypothetical protein